MSHSSLPPLLFITDRLSYKLELKPFLDPLFFTIDAATGLEGIELLSKNQIKFILIDSQVEEGNGFQITKQIRQIKRYFLTPLILIIDQKDESQVKAAIESGATNVLLPPFNKENISSCFDLATHWSKTFESMTSFSQDLKKIAEHDPLTGLYNRFYLYDHGKKEISKSLRFGDPISLLMLDIDYFKNVNDQYGHLNGDEILFQIATLINRNTRTYDMAVRFGGEEFVILLPSTTLEQAVLVAEKIRKNIEKHNFYTKENQEIKLTISIGVASISPHITHLENLIYEADLALYHAKENGRNQVSTHEELI